MATKTGTKKKSGKKTAKKATKAKGGKRNAIVAAAREGLREACPHVLIGTRPMTTDGSGKLATKVADFNANWATYLESCREHFAGGGTAKDMPAFPVGKLFDPNSGLMTSKQYDDLLDAAAAEDAVEVVVPTKYNPVQVSAAHALNCRTLRRGQVKLHPNPPKGWDEKTFGPWHDIWEDEDGKPIKEPSGMFFDDDLPRRAHADQATDLVTDENAILTFGNMRVVCGDGTHNGAAAFLIRAHKGGNYGRGDEARKRLSLAGIKEVRNVVFKIEDRPNNGGAWVMKSRWVNGNRVIKEVPFMPGQVLTAGHLYKGEGKKPLDAKDIRKLDGDTKGLKFKPLDKPIVGKAIPFAALWGDISQDKKGVAALKARGGRSDEYEAAKPEDKTLTNLRTTSRTSPHARFAFGFRSVQADMVPWIKAQGEARIEDGDFSMGVVIGSRSADEWNVGVHAAREDTEDAKPKKAAAKKSKAKSKKKDEPKTDKAPDVEHDTADETEAVTA